MDEILMVQDLLPEATTISRRVSKRAQEKKEQLKAYIPSIIQEKKASMTIDMWTDAYVKRNFLCATFHYEENLMLKEIVLGVKSMDLLSSSGENIRKKLLTILKEFDVFGLDNIKFTTDRGKNIIKALEGEIRINCSNHLLSNVVDAAFEQNLELKQIVTASKQLVKFFKKGNLQHLLQTSLKNHCPTRWNSYLEMFKSIAENWTDIMNVLAEKNAIHRVNDINYQVINEIYKYFKHIDIISRKLQGSKYPTMCYVLPSISRLQNISQQNSEDLPVLKTLKENILHNIENNWLKNISIIHKVASFLFPPTNNMVELQNDLTEIKKFCIEQMIEDNEQDVSTNIYSHNSSTSAASNTSDSLSSPNSAIMEEHQFFFPNLVNGETLSLSHKATSELELYVTERISLNEKFNVIMWWVQNKGKYALLSKLAIKVLSMPASSAASERVFSMTGNIITEKRNRVAPKTVNNLIFLHSQSKYN